MLSVSNQPDPERQELGPPFFESQDCPTVWVARVVMTNEESSWAAYKIYNTVHVESDKYSFFIYFIINFSFKS